MVQEHFHNRSSNYNKTIAIFADIHYSKNYPLQILDDIIQNIQKNKPDYICIPGDIIDDASVLKTEEISKLIDFFKELSFIAPLILSYGNHDEVTIRFHKSKYEDTSKFFHSLNKMNQIYFLDNKNLLCDSLNFIGYHPNYTYFESKEKTKLENIDQIEKLIIPNKCNILLCHSPIQILNYPLKVNYILSGHMHNGLVLAKENKKNWGLVGPYSTPFPKLSRGTIQKEDVTLIITGGAKKISNSSSILLRPLNKIYPIEIDYLII